MSEIIKINQSEINGESVQTVEARILYERLGLNPAHWARWSQTNIEQSPFAMKGEDWEGFTMMVNGNKTTDYALTLDFAKRLSMMAKTEKGEEVRKYFIACEKQFKSATVHFLIPKTLPEALRLAADLADRNEVLQAKIDSDSPKVEFAEAVRRMEGACKIGVFCKAIGYGRNTFFAMLRADKVLMPDNMPYQRFKDAGLLDVIEQVPYTDSKGKSHPAFTTMVTGKGQVWLERKYRQAEAA